MPLHKDRGTKYKKGPPIEDPKWKPYKPKGKPTKRPDPQYITSKRG